MEADHRRLVFGADRTNRDRFPILHRPLLDEVDRIWSYRRLWQFVGGHVEPMDNYPRVERQQTFGGREQRIDVDFLDPGLLDDQLAEAHQQLFQGCHAHRLAPANAFQSLEDVGLLHHPKRKRGVQRRQGQSAVFEDLDQLSACAEQDYRPKLRIETAADDQLVAIELRHRLNGYALEVLGASLLRDRFLDVLERGLHGIGITQVELHAADIGLVGDGQRVQLQDDGIADLFGCLQCFLFGRRNARFDRRYVVAL